MLEIDLTFPHSYAVEEFRELPGTGSMSIPLIYVPPPKRRAEHDGLWLKIKPIDRTPWVGVFAFGGDSPPAITRVLSSPDSNFACVISRGAGYWMNSKDPQVWERVPALPILDVRALIERELLVFSSFTRLAAYGPGGLAWTSPQVCWDDLKIEEITSTTIEGTGYDPTFQAGPRMRVLVDVRTGQSLLPAPKSVDGRPFW